jgi:HD-GYP domain-containing protein (c-di-GMP phosphodiesterase class II)
MVGYQAYATPLRRYLLTVSVVGPVVAAVLAASGGDWTQRRVWLAALLVVLAAIAERYALQLTHHAYVSVNTAVYVAMMVALPWPGVGALAFAAIAAAELLRQQSRRTLDLPEMLFNVGQGTLYVSAGAVCYGLVARRAPGTEIAGFGSVAAIVAGAAVMHLVNTGLVAIAGAKQVGAAPLRVWRQTIALDLVPHVVLTMVGAIAAAIVANQPLVLPLVALPGVLMQRAVRQTILLRTETHKALASLVEIVELRDPYTAGHSRRVATAARAIAERLELTAEEADLIESAGRVHDLGKVALDPHVLLKAGKLNDEEWLQMKLHPVYGADVVAQFAAYREGTGLVRHHHERWDGRGYPDGLQGEAIPLGARILAVADTFDALTSDRPYRAGMDRERAIAILREGAGSHWDPRVVEAMVAVLAEMPERVPLHQTRVAAPLSEPRATPRGRAA